MDAPEMEFRKKFKPDYSGMTVTEVPFCTMEDHSGTPMEYKLDVITAQNAASGKLPVVFFIHGGGFLKPNDKRQAYISMFARELTKSGYAVVSPDYPQFDSEQQLAAAGGEAAGYAKAAQAIHYAYRFVAENGKQWNLDASRTAIIGGSAGGWATFYTIANYRDPYRAFVNCWGAPAVLPPVSNFPATLSIHGTEDVLVPYALETAAQTALEQAGIEHPLITLPGCGHTPLNKFGEFMPVILEFLRARMEGERLL